MINDFDENFESDWPHVFTHAVNWEIWSRDRGMKEIKLSGEFSSPLGADKLYL